MSEVLIIKKEQMGALRGKLLAEFILVMYAESRILILISESN